MLNWVVLLIPPTTLFTALAFWFGWTMTDSRSRYFGLDPSTLEFTNTDYVLRSPDALIAPTIFIAFAMLLGLVMHAFVRRILNSDVDLRIVRLAATGSAVLGFVAIALVVHSLLFDDPFDLQLVRLLLRPALLGGGALCMAYSYFILVAVTDHSDTRPSSAPAPAWEQSVYLTLVFLVVLSLFWATTLYARDEGRVRAEHIAGHLKDQPAVTVYSAESLALGSSVSVERNDMPDARYRYKYSGLRLLVRSADKFFLLPNGWTHGKGTTIIIKDEPSIRIELKPGKS
ncbi:hypothetical protein AVL61_16910 [Kocuria rosea subsp. polaris]|uniref:Uncharacterized protein n=1 Tax=Kocuria rosea subsp. polaris TaxID=136273 RepID=A0A0W8IBN6_KOCRO|nr:hypothetical protein AVL61_16910 [Kocuria polaris]